MLLGAPSGFRILSLLLNLYKQYAEGYIFLAVGDNLGNFISFLISIFFYIIAGGGFSVLAGCGLILVHLHKLGRKIIAIGAGIGFVGMFLYILYVGSFESSIEPGETAIFEFLIFTLITLADFYFIGAILTIIGRKKMKSFEKEAKQEEQEWKNEVQNHTIIPAYERKISCSQCGADNKLDAKFCHKCGASLEEKVNLEGRSSFMMY